MGKADEAWASLPIKDQIRFVFGVSPRDMFPARGNDGLSATAPNDRPTDPDHLTIGPESTGR